MLSEVTPRTCRDYADTRTKGGARRDLEDLRAAINHHARRNLHVGLVIVDLPEKGKAREEWLTRDEVARLVWVCYRHGRTVRLPRGRNKGAVVESQWHDLRHLARFILFSLYTGSRSGAVLSASLYKGQGRSYIDLEHGVFYRLAEGKRETNKRQPPVRLPPRLIAHIRRWQAKGLIATHIVEWDGVPVKSVKVAWARALKLAKITKKAPPHTLRHTAATWLMQQGVDKWEAAGFLGMSTDDPAWTDRKQPPDRAADAASAITRKRRKSSP
ncbi:tyrosine-type recombinase/integrase [Microvirga lotononidis]|uniref:Site-specific recombinase XerD n=1 Tax=Microvirga lotononidis TaxID=864069 RepID=I4YPT6_9HYPH|nr:tyrosine-type recombinase/integrase [Microvirga lotononidis]EIM25978.1 site-specific recombinase XerD [Microvirga lotononidis]WQO25889.1 tyrosine-type recombinase/integrase [Microvirga lotononidis]